MKNNKGFVLVETIITAVFVLGFFSFLVANLLPLIGDYEKEIDYDSIESKYDAHLIRKMILKDEGCRTKNLVTLSSKGYYEFDGTDLCLYLENVNYCNKLLSSDFLDVKKVVLTGYGTRLIKESAKSFDRPLEEYINSMTKYDDSSINFSQYRYQRRLIVWFNDGRLANIELLLNDDSSFNCGGATC